MKTVLLTQGSGLFPLALARSFHAAGHRVVVADCWSRTLCRYSRAVDQYFHVPPPAMETEAWAGAILRIARDVDADLIVPIFEEALYLAEALEQHADAPAAFTADFETLVRLHNKWSFNQFAESLELPVPQSEHLTSREQLLEAFEVDRNRVFKPAFSRWARYVVVKPQSLSELINIEPSPQEPWLAQEFLPGRPFATFSLAHKGRLTAHTTYAADMTTGYGPTYGYRPVRHPQTSEWVRAFVAGSKYTGQIGLDFIEDAAGEIAAIECNPRSTGALYLLKDDPRFTEAILNPEQELVEPISKRPCISRLGMLGCLFRKGPYFPGWKVWADNFLRGRAIRIFEFRDPLPAFSLPLSLCTFFWRCRKEGKDARTLATLEREWTRARVGKIQSVES